MAEIKLKPTELEALDFAMEVYGGTEKIIDAMDLGSVVRAMNCNPSLETLKKLGVTEKPGEKKMKAEDIIPLVVELRKQQKDEGCYEDFFECLKLYDKAQDGHMMATELNHILLSLGEKLNEGEVNELFDDCLDEEDDEGQIIYDKEAPQAVAPRNDGRSIRYIANMLDFSRSTVSDSLQRYRKTGSNSIRPWKRKAEAESNK